MSTNKPQPNFISKYGFIFLGLIVLTTGILSTISYSMNEDLQLSITFLKSTVAYHELAVTFEFVSIIGYTIMIIFGLCFIILGNEIRRLKIA